MNLSQRSQLLNNISLFALDSRIGKAALSVKGTSTRMGERVSLKAGYSPVIMDYRYYQKGDAVKDIDWKLSARTEKLFVKIREGYRQTEFVIVPDGSESMRTCYNDGVSKFTTALTLAYIAGRSALKSRDRVYVLYGGKKLRAETEFALLDLLMDIETQKAENGFWETAVQSSSNVFIFSDFFIETELLSEYLKAISRNTKNIFLLAIHDPFEQNFNFNGRYRFLDSESEASLLSETRRLNARYHHLYNEHYQAVLRTGKSFGARFGKAVTTEDPYNAFIKAVS
ncbi:MAG: DUF58 domain-containing protein [Spirochaetota bacterium]